VRVSLRIRTACVAFLGLLGMHGLAQRPTCPKSGSVIARPCELDQWPLPERRRGEPLYPALLRHAGVQGEVRVRFVVDTVGKVTSFQILGSTHELFANAVKNAMPRQQFEPPRRAGVLTSVAVEELVAFADPAPGWKSGRNAQLIHQIVDSTGRLLTTVFAFTPRDSARAPSLSSADSLEIYKTVVDTLTLMNVVKEPPAAWCVQPYGRVPSAELFGRLRRSGRRVVGVADCPRTYTSMVYTPGDPKRPRGWIDPVRIDVDSLVSWAQDTVILTTEMHQGTATTVIKCEVVRVAGKWAQAFCVTTQRRIS
jgi:TonB family protein